MRSNQWRRLSRTLVAAAGALFALAACTFSSEQPYFAARDAAFPFADGAVYHWRIIGESEADDRDITFHRDGARYSITDPKEAEPMGGLMFAPISSTRTEDYILQMQRDGEEGVMYGFVWRVGDGYRILVDPRLVKDDAGEAAMARYCTLGQYSECALKGRDALLRLYRRLIYDRYVRPARAPSEYVELTPLPAAGEH
jgi:hypothetical protein